MFSNQAKENGVNEGDNNPDQACSVWAIPKSIEEKRIAMVLLQKWLLLLLQVTSIDHSSPIAASVQVNARKIANCPRFPLKIK
jgi:hypothetical protein